MNKRLLARLTLGLFGLGYLTIVYFAYLQAPWLSMIVASPVLALALHWAVNNA